MKKFNPSRHTPSKGSRKRSSHKVYTLPLATMAASLTAATYLGGQPVKAVQATTISTPTYTETAKGLTNSTSTATAKKLTHSTSSVYQDREADVSVYQDREYIPLGDKKPWLQYPNILEFRRLRGRNSNATEIKSDEEGSDNNWKFVNDRTAMYAHLSLIHI